MRARPEPEDEVTPARYERAAGLASAAAAKDLAALRRIASLFLADKLSDSRAGKEEAEALAAAIVRRERELLFGDAA